MSCVALISVPSSRNKTTWCFDGSESKTKSLKVLSWEFFIHFVRTRWSLINLVINILKYTESIAYVARWNECVAFLRFTFKWRIKRITLLNISDLHSINRGQSPLLFVCKHYIISGILTEHSMFVIKSNPATASFRGY